MRPQDRVALSGIADNFAQALMTTFKKENDANKRAPLEGSKASIGHGDVVIAAITSCTNTSNPSVMMGAGLLPPKRSSAASRPGPGSRPPWRPAPRWSPTI